MSKKVFVILFLSLFKGLINWFSFNYTKKNPFQWNINIKIGVNVLSKATRTSCFIPQHCQDQKLQGFKFSSAAKQVPHQCNNLPKTYQKNQSQSSEIQRMPSIVSIRLWEEIIDSRHDLGWLVAEKFSQTMLSIFLSLFEVLKNSGSSVFFGHPANRLQIIGN